MHYAITHVFRIFQTRDHTEHTALLSKLEVRLEAYYVIQRSLKVFFTKLYNRKGLFAIACGTVFKADGFQRTICQRQIPAFRHYLNGHTAFKYIYSFEFVQRRSLRLRKRTNKQEVFKPCHRTVEIIAAAVIA